MKNVCLIFLAVVLCSAFFGACGENNNLRTSDTGLPEDLPDQELRPFKVVITSSGIKKARVYAGYSQTFNSKGIQYLSDSVTADFYDDFGNHSSKLTSTLGTLNEKEKLLYAQGNVVIVSDSGIILLTDKIYYNSDTQKIFTDVFVTIIEGLDTLQGDGFESDRSLINWEIKKPTGVFHLGAGKIK